MTTFSPSPLQSAIGTALRSADHNIMVEAVAGSGKTTTCVWLLGEIPRGTALMAPSVVFLAFNKSIAETLSARCPRRVTCSTFHSLGFRALKDSGVVDRKVQVDGRKCAKILWKLTDRDDPDFQGILKLVSLFKGQPEIPSEGEARSLVAHYDLDFQDEKKAVWKAQEVLLKSSQDFGSIDFDDMLWLPIRQHLDLSSFDWIFVDEAQDTNDIQVELLDRLQLPERESTLGQCERCGNVAIFGGRGCSACGVDWGENNQQRVHYTSSTRLVAVGDRNQAIYGFRGANSDAMSRIAQRFAMRSYPLDVSYRCPKNVVLEAQKLFL